MRRAIPCLSLFAALASAPPGVMAENIATFSFAPYLEGPEITLPDLAGRVTCIVAPCAV